MVTVRSEFVDMLMQTTGHGHVPGFRRIWCMYIIYVYVYIYINICIHTSYLPTYRHTDIQTYRHTDIQTYRHTGIQTYRHTDIQTYRHTDIHTYRHTDIQTYRHTDIQKYRHTDIQTYRHTDIQTYRHTDIQTYRHTYMHACMHTYIHTFRKQVHLYSHLIVLTFVYIYIVTLCIWSPSGPSCWDSWAPAPFLAIFWVSLTQSQNLALRYLGCCCKNFISRMLRHFDV